MILSELLDSVGLTKIELAKLLGVSRKTVQRMGDQVSDEVLSTIDKYRLTESASLTIPVPEVIESPKTILPKNCKAAKDCSEAEIRAIWKRRGTESDSDIAISLGLVTSSGGGDAFAFRRDYIDEPIRRMMQ